MQRKRAANLEILQNIRQDQQSEKVNANNEILKHLNASSTAVQMWLFLWLVRNVS